MQKPILGIGSVPAIAVVALIRVQVQYNCDSEPRAARQGSQQGVFREVANVANVADISILHVAK